MRWWCALALAGCAQAPLFGAPTGATCPPDSTLTYATFAAPFMQRYCTRCHSSVLVGAQRHGAPSLHDFDTRDGIAAFPDHVDATAAAGPDAINTAMPPDAPRPSLDERRQLGAWLACGMP